MIPLPASLLMVGLCQVLLWKFIDKNKIKLAKIDPALNSFKDLTRLMIPIYAFPPLFAYLDVTQFAVLIPYVAVSEYWYIRWRHYYDCNDEIQRNYLHSSVTKMFFGLMLIGFLLLIQIMLLSQFTAV